MSEIDKTKPDNVIAKKLILKRMNTGFSLDEIDMLETEEQCDEIIGFFKAKENEALNPKQTGTFKIARIQNARKVDPTSQVPSTDVIDGEVSRYNSEQVWRPNRAWQTPFMKSSKDSFVLRLHRQNDGWGDLV
jgi:hypothetical protein